MSEQLNPDGSLFYLKNSFVPEVSVSVATNFYTFALEQAGRLLRRTLLSAASSISRSGDIPER